MSDRNPLHEVQLDSLLGIVKTAARKFADSHDKIKVFVDGNLVHEVAARATVTLQEYNMSGRRLGEAEYPVELPNFYKEAGHVAYWLVRVKPLRLASHGFIHKALEYARMPFDDDVLRAVFSNTSTTGVNILLNEYVALYVATIVIRKSEQKALNSMLAAIQPTEHKEIREQFQQLTMQSRRRTASMTDKVLNSLRYDTHSPNSLALLFEAMIGTGFPFGSDGLVYPQSAITYSPTLPETPASDAL